ncbi:MAG: type II toxin-antitoxin system VapC family toxin [Phycisphaerae bacterium]|nr:type II toxin-antitoxin system VapC family toxin [Phycisphaerae bacterium]
MKQKVYIETSVVSYLSGRLSRDVVVVGRQEITREIWPLLTERFDCYVSALVREEVERGDPEAAGGRLAVLADMTALTISDEARDLAKAMIQNGLMPSQFAEDALHIAIAATNGMDYVLTWNFRHINNVQTKVKIETLIEGCGYEPPLVCSPEELFGESP